MARINQRKNVGGLPMEQALVMLADEFAEIVSVNAFLVSSMASLMSSDEGANHEVIEGARYCSDASQARALEIKASLNRIMRQCQAGGRKKQTGD